MKHKFTLLLFFTQLTLSINAAHIIGGFISHECLGISDNKANIKVTFTVYRDGNSPGAPFDKTLSIGVYKKNDVDDFEFMRAINQGHGIITAETFSSIYNLSENVDFVSLEQTNYVSQISIPLDGKDYVISNQRCCRQNNIINIRNPSENGFALEILISAYALENCINSIPLIDTPQFTALPNTDETLKFPFQQDDKYSVTYKLDAPNQGGGLMDLNINEQFCC